MGAADSGSQPPPRAKAAPKGRLTEPGVRAAVHSGLDWHGQQRLAAPALSGAALPRKATVARCVLALLLHVAPRTPVHFAAFVAEYEPEAAAAVGRRWQGTCLGQLHEHRRGVRGAFPHHL